MKAVAWLSALMIFTSLYAAVRLERLAHSEHPERAKAIVQEFSDKATHKTLQAFDRLIK